MLHHIKSIFQKFSEPQKTDVITCEVATAVLLAEVMCADHKLDEQEKKTIIHILQEQFRLNEKQAVDLFSYAEEKTREVVSLQEYTSQINKLLNNMQRVKLVENIWRVIYADGEIDKYEEHLIRRIAELLYVSHSDFIKTKHKILAEG